MSGAALDHALGGELAAEDHAADVHMEDAPGPLSGSSMMGPTAMMPALLISTSIGQHRRPWRGGGRRPERAVVPASRRGTATAIGGVGSSRVIEADGVRAVPPKGLAVTVAFPGERQVVLGPGPPVVEKPAGWRCRCGRGEPHRGIRAFFG
jgi:hypothetical protein